MLGSSIDQQFFYVDDGVFKVLEERLNKPVENNLALEKLLNQEVPWEE